MWRVREQIGCDENIKYSGKEITIAVLDTGIFPHPDFSGRILSFKDFVHKKLLPYDDSGHGTHVAGCIAGDGYASNGKYKGIACGTNLVVGKVLDHMGEGELSGMLQGIQWILDRKKEWNIRILNISMAFEKQVSQEKIKQLTELLEEAWKMGILTVVAAGNKGPTVRSISPIGIGEHILSVGCHDLDYHIKGVTLCETYSGRGPGIQVMKKPDLVAPGTNIMATSNQCMQKGNQFVNAYEAKSGTSFATPIVSGVAALVMEKYPKLSHSEVKRRLCYSALDLKEPWNKQGWGMVNVKRALGEL